VALPPHPTLVCFDLGGVLVRICRSWPEAFAVAGITPRDSEQLGFQATREARRPFGERYQSGQITCAEYYQGTHDALRGLYSVAEIERLHHAWTREEYPGVRELVATLNDAAGITTACLSNTNHAHWQRLINQERYRTVQSLRHRLASHLLGCAKPDAEIYERAQAALGRSPAEIIFFDDLAENVAAAQRAGWRAVHIDPTGDTAAQIRSGLAEAGLAFA
jgi:putative hydrolase of the HAD superfamily